MIAVAALCSCVAAEFQVAPPDPSDVRLVTNQFVAMPDGARLPLRAWLPQGETNAVVVALHGFNDYSRSFEGLGSFLAARGIATYAYDQRGFGGAPLRSFWPGVPALVDDLVTTARLVRQQHPGLPLYCMGESMGGAVVMVAVAADVDRHPASCDAAIFSAPAVLGLQRLPLSLRIALRIANSIAPQAVITRSPIRIKPTDNLAVLRAMASDPMVIKGASISTLAGLVDLGTQAFDAAPRVKSPFLYLHGGRDMIVPRKASEPAMRNLHPNGVIAWYPNGYHLLFRDLSAAAVDADIAHWILDRSVPLPSGADSYAHYVLEHGTDH